MSEMFDKSQMSEAIDVPAGWFSRKLTSYFSVNERKLNISQLIIR